MTPAGVALMALGMVALIVIVLWIENYTPKTSGRGSTSQPAGQMEVKPYAMVGDAPEYEKPTVPYVSSDNISLEERAARHRLNQPAAKLKALPVHYPQLLEPVIYIDGKPVKRL
jgi:hypothetical protein